ncbi:MAG: hypothetical protein DMF51_15940 [Acidobacteria bacterium]|nr:MAG: hypothetical protein DMF51_15940 [Acidobacteriota bacterium]
MTVMTIRSQSGLRVAWVIAILWNLISTPATFLGAVPAIQKGNTVAWVALTFPFAGAWLLIWAVHLTLRWRRFGTSQFDVSDHTVTPGGWLRGTISARNLPEVAAPRLTFSCINRVVSGSGNNRSVREKILWQEDQTIQREGLLAGPEGAAIPVAFRLPADVSPTRSVDPDNRILWRLGARASIPGVDYSEQFEIPVAAAPAGPAPSERSEPQSSVDDAPARPVESRIRVEPGPEGGTRFVLPAARNLRAALLATLFGSVFCGMTGLLAVLIHSGAVDGPFVFVPWILLTAFAAFSLLIMAIVIQAWLQTTILDATPGGLVVTGRVLGLSRSRSIPCRDLRDITLSVGMQAGETPYYDLVIARADGSASRVTAALRNKREAEWLAAEIRRALA